MDPFVVVDQDEKMLGIPTNEEAETRRSRVNLILFLL
jgi:hypothetical protein